MPILCPLCTLYNANSSIAGPYAEHGIYQNFIEGHELNGASSIDWAHTIEKHLPIISDGNPIYIEHEPRKVLRAGANFITRLHKAVLTECSREPPQPSDDNVETAD